MCPVCDRSAGDARRDERFILPTDVRLRKLGPDGTPQKEERTIAHDLSRSGMRILTSWSDLEAGDQVAVEEVGGTFNTSAVVRHVRRGSDHITRVGVEFLEKQDRLVGTTTSIRRPAFNSVQASPPVPVVVPRPSFVSPPPFRHAFTPPRPSAPPPQQKPVPPPVVPRPARPIEDVLEEIVRVRTAARDLIADAKIWEALDCLAKAQALANGTPEEQAIRILTWETQGKVPSLARAAHQNLEELARQEPAAVAVHSALGRIYWEAGLAARARGAFKHVLTLDPSNREAAAALKALSDRPGPDNRPPRQG